MTSDEIFVLRDGKLKGLPGRTFREGLRGAALEAALQDLLADFPSLIPGRQIAPADPDPPRFVLLTTESTLAGRFSVDHVLVDHLGVPTVIETKLFENPDARRDVIGQILEYAAIGVSEWQDGQLRARATEFWGDRGKSLDDVLQERFGDVAEDIDAFWAKVDANLQNNTIRLIVAGDQVRPEVRRILEFLNQEMQNVEVYALEFQCFGRGDGEIVIVPKIIGQTQQAADRRRVRRGTQRSWSPAALREQYDELALTNDLRSRRLGEILDWAIRQGQFVESVARNPCFSVGCEDGKRLLTFQVDGDMHWYVAVSLEILGENGRARFYERLVEIGVADDSHHPDRVTSSKSLGSRLDELSDGQYSALRQTIEQALQRSNVDRQGKTI